MTRTLQSLHRGSAARRGRRTPHLRRDARTRTAPGRLISYPLPLALRCPFCDHNNGASAKFCNECGSPLHLQPCGHCSAINHRSDACCYHCGAALADPVASSAAETAAATRNPLPSRERGHLNPPRRASWEPSSLPHGREKTAVRTPQRTRCPRRRPIHLRGTPASHLPRLRRSPRWSAPMLESRDPRAACWVAPRHGGPEHGGGGLPSGCSSRSDLQRISSAARAKSRRCRARVKPLPVRPRPENPLSALPRRRLPPLQRRPPLRRHLRRPRLALLPRRIRLQPNHRPRRPPVPPRGNGPRHRRTRFARVRLRRGHRRSHANAAMP